MNAKIKARVQIRWAVKQDLDDMVNLFAESLRCPVTQDQILKWLNERHTIGMVATLECGTIVGVFIYELQRTKIHLLKLAVDPDLQRMGIGRQILAKLKGKLSGRRTKLTLDCRESNLEAQKFYRSCGLKAIGIRREHYSDGEDAYAFEYRLPAEDL